MEKNGLKKYKCLCCGCYTLDEPAGDTFDICPVCFWEDDGLQNDQPDYAGGANRLSLNQAKENYRKYGAIEEQEIRNVRGPHSFETVQDPEIPYIELWYKVTGQRDCIYVKCKAGSAETVYHANLTQWIKDEEAARRFSSGEGLFDITEEQAIEFIDIAAEKWFREYEELTR